MKKKIGAMILAMTMLFSLSMTTLASEAVPTIDKSQMTVEALSAIDKVKLNGTPIFGNEQMGYFWIDANGRTQAPVRLLVESMGYSISYNKGVVTIPGGPKGDIKITIGTNKITVGGSEVTMDTISATINGRTYIPLRYVAEGLGATVTAKGSTQGVVIDVNYALSSNRSIDGVGNIPLENCENLQKVVEKYQDKVYSDLGIIELIYSDSTGTGLYLTITEGTNLYRIDGLDFVEDAEPQYEMVYALINDVVEETSRNTIKETLQSARELLLKDYNPETGVNQEALQWIKDNAGKTIRIGNVNFTWSGRGCTGFTISKNTEN